MPERVELGNGAFAYVPSFSELSANDQYNTLDKSTMSLDEVKNFKNKALNETCNLTILVGFTSSALGDGVAHTYGFSMEDQANMNQELTMILVDPPTDTIIWRTLDAGELPHTADQFKQVCADARTFKYSTITKYWGYVKQVNSATTWQDVDAVVWA